MLHLCQFIYSCWSQNGSILVTMFADRWCVHQLSLPSTARLTFVSCYLHQLERKHDFSFEGLVVLLSVNFMSSYIKHYRKPFQTLAQKALHDHCRLCLIKVLSDCQNPHFFVPKVCACWWYVHGLSSCSDTSQSYLHPKMWALLDLRTLDLAKLVYHRFMLLLFRTLWLYLLLFIVVNSLNEVCQEIVFCIDLLTSMKIRKD